MNEYTQYQTKIEDVLKKNLPQILTKEWQKSIFSDLPECVKQKHIEPLITPCRNLLNLGGKRWRPLLLVLSSGLPTTDGLICDLAYELTPVVELVHTASLIHDDIEDAADIRRGEPCAHITHGIDTAINSGSWLYFAAYAAIENAKIEITQKQLLTQILTTQIRRLHLGQAMDIEWHKNNNSLPTSDEYMAMVRMKTGTLASLASQVGIIAGGADISQSEKLGKIASDIGVAFQIHDDIINLTTGNKGKKRGDDIVEGKKSMPILLHLQEKPHDFDKIMRCFAKARVEGIASPSVEECISIINGSNALQKAKELGKSLKENAILTIKDTWNNSASQKICNLFEIL